MKSGLSGCRASQLAGLLQVQADVDVPWLSDAGASADEVLRARLRETMPLDPSRPDAAPAVLLRPCEALRPYASIGALLADPEADLDALATLKEYAKALARLSRCPAAEAATTTLYYAAIAAALVHCDARITRHACGRLAEYLAGLEAKPWMPEALADLFRRARGACRARQETDVSEDADSR